MADETKGVGGSGGEEIGAVWLKLGLKVDDLKDKLGEAKKHIKDGLDDKPVEDFNKEASKTEQIADNLSEKFEDLAKKVLAAFAVKTVVEFFNECEDLMQVQQYAEQKLAITMQNRFNATQKEIKAVTQLANELMDVSGISDQITLAGAASLATYVDSAETVKSMLPVMQAIANNRFGFGEITSEDFADIGKTMGEAFAEGGLEPLKSLNIGVSELDSEQFKALTTEAERMAYITDLVKSRVGDVNGLLSETLTIDRQLNASTTELKETIGSIYQVFIVPIKSMVLSIVNSANAALKNLTSLLGIEMVQAENATNKATSSAAKYFENVSKKATEAKRAIMGFDIIQKLGLTKDEDDTNSILDNLNATDNSGVITQGVRFEYKEGGFADRISKALKTIGEGIAKYIGDKFGIAFDEETLEKFVSKLEEVAKWIKENPEEFAAFCDKILGVVKALGALIIIITVIKWLGNLAFAINNIGALFGGFGTTAAAAGSTFAGLGTTIGGFKGIITGLGTAAKAVFSGLGAVLTNPWFLAIAAIAAVIAAVVYFWDDIKAGATAFGKWIGNFISNLVQSICGAVSSVVNFIKGLFNDEVEVKATGHRAGSEVKERNYGGYVMGERTSGDYRIKAPHAATGAFVSANTPTLTVVGDNRRQGEFVLTEEQFADAAKKHGGGSPEVVAVLREILEAIKSQNLTAVFDMDTIAKFVLNYAKKQERATGKPAF